MDAPRVASRNDRSGPSFHPGRIREARNEAHLHSLRAGGAGGLRQGSTPAPLACLLGGRAARAGGSTGLALGFLAPLECLLLAGDAILPAALL